MKKQHLLGCGLALAMMSTVSQASVITQTGQFGTQGSPTDIPLGFINQTISLDGFDSALGTLESVLLTFSSQVDAEGSSKNVSTAAGRADIGIFFFSDWAASGAGQNYTFQSANFGVPALYAESAPENTFNLLPNTASDTFSYALTSGLLGFTFDLTDAGSLANFIDTGSLDFLFSGFGTTNINNDVQSGTGVFTNTFNAGVFGRIDLVYNYSETPPTQVSAPATGALMALSLGMIGFMRKRLS